jgi:hypothetical protein
VQKDTNSGGGKKRKKEKIPTQAVQKMRFQAPRRTKQKSARKKEKLFLR